MPPKKRRAGDRGQVSQMPAAHCDVLVVVVVEPSRHKQQVQLGDIYHSI